MIFISSQSELVFADYNPDSVILSFDIDVNTDPSINYGVPLGTFSGTTSEPNTDKIYITVRDPDGIKVMNILRVSDSNGYFNFRFNVGDPTVLPKEGTYTATAHIYNEAGETFEESEQAGTFIVTFENIFQVDEPEPAPDPLITDLRTDKTSYTEGDIIEVSGHIDNHWPSHPVLINVDIANGGSLLPVSVQVESNGDFRTELIANNPEWTTEGTYTLRALHVSGSFMAYSSFDYYFAEPEPLDPVITRFSTDKNSYTEGDTIIISGHIDNHWEDFPALLHVDVAQRGSLLPFEAQIDSNGDFQTQITAGGSEWITEGTYTLDVMHVAGSFDASTTFEYILPEPETPPEPQPEPNPDSGSIVNAITVFTDRSSYESGDTIRIFGQVKEILSGFPVTFQLIAANGNIVTIQQLEVDNNNRFSTTLDSGGALWISSGAYTVKVIYGTQSRTAQTTFHFTSDNVEPQPNPETPPEPVPIPEPVTDSGFELEIKLPVSAGEEFGIYADANEANNLQRLEKFVLGSDNSLELLRIISIEMKEGANTARENLDTVKRWNFDGIETLGYGIHWTTLRAYHDISSIADQVIEMVNGGMSLQAAFAQFDYIIERANYSNPQPPPEPILVSVPEPILVPAPEPETPIQPEPFSKKEKIVICHNNNNPQTVYLHKVNHNLGTH